MTATLAATWGPCWAVCPSSASRCWISHCLVCLLDFSQHLDEPWVCCCHSHHCPKGTDGCSTAPWTARKKTLGSRLPSHELDGLHQLPSVWGLSWATPLMLGDFGHFRLQMMWGAGYAVWCWCRQEASWWKINRQAASSRFSQWALWLWLGT